MNTQDNWQTTVTIEDEIRASVWGAIFPGARVPVMSILPVRADLPGMPGVRVYFLDLAAISEAQLEELIRQMADLFTLDPESVRQDIHAQGVPILADSTSLQVTDEKLIRSMAF